jgi:diacylglycerol kinase
MAPIDDTEEQIRRPARRWRDKFRDAGHGVKLGVRGHCSFFGHFFAAALVIAAATTLQCGVMEWAILLGCIGAVLTTELLNSALETLFHGLDDSTKERLTGALDIAAGAVLMASATAAAVGGIVLGYRMWIFLN